MEWPLTILYYDNCTSLDGQIRENVGLQRHRITEASDYRGCQITEAVRLQRLSDYRGCQITEVSD